MILSSIVPSLTSVITPQLYGRKIIEQYDIDEIIENDNQRQLEEVISEIKNEEITGIRKQKDLKRVTFSSISFAFSVFVYIQSIISNAELKESIINTIQQSKHEIISEFTTQFGALNKLDKKFVVERDLNLRTAPSTKSSIICVLGKYTLVDMTEAIGEWAHIKSFDYFSGEILTGWVLKKYLTNGRILQKQN